MRRPNITIGKLFVLTAFSLIAIQVGSNFSKERKMIDELETDPTRTVCIGRNLVDMPAHLDVTYGMTYFAFWHIQTRIENEESFNARLEEKAKELSIAKNSYGRPSLELVRSVDGWSGKIFQFSREHFRSISRGEEMTLETVKIEGYVHAQGVSFDITSTDSHEEDLPKLVQLIAKLRVRGTDEIPSESGFCINRGIIVSHDNSTLSEGITAFADNPKVPTVSFVFDSTAGAKSSDTLLHRIASSEIRKEYPSSFKNLRIGHRQINGHDGEEVATRVKEEDGRVNHSFIWESLPVKEDVYRPQIRMEFSTGNSSSTELKKTPYTDAEAIAVWDQITATLRVRPTH